MEKFRLLLVSVLVSLVVVAPAARAQSAWPDGQLRPTGTARDAVPVGGFDGSAQRALRTDATGILRTTEEYPRETDIANVFTGASGIALTTGIALIGTGWSSYPYQLRAAHIKRVTSAGGNNVPVVRLYLFSSDDNLTFYPVTRGDVLGITAAVGDTTRVDTLQFILPSAPAQTQDWIIPIPTPTYGYQGRYLAFKAARDSTASSPAQQLSVFWIGRKY